MTARLRYALRRPRFSLPKPPNHAWYAYRSPRKLAIFISAACTLVSACNVKSPIDLAAYLTVSAYASLLRKRLDAGRISCNPYLYAAYCDKLPCYLTFALHHLRLLRRLYELHYDPPCATLSIVLIPCPVCYRSPWKSIPSDTLCLLYLYPKHRPLLL